MLNQIIHKYEPYKETRSTKLVPKLMTVSVVYIPILYDGNIQVHRNRIMQFSFFFPKNAMYFHVCFLSVVYSMKEAGKCAVLMRYELSGV